MSVSRRTGNADVGGRPFLALVSVTFIVAGLLKSGEWICFPLLVLGFTSAVLFAFHSRIQKLKIFDKLEMALTVGSEPDEVQNPADPGESQGRDQDRPPTLSEIKAAAKYPTARRKYSRYRPR
ncbi:MAG TPA: hypothetical protein VIT89_04060 [Solirubrobacterales bacterium]